MADTGNTPGSHRAPTSPPTADDATVRGDAARVLSETEALDWLRQQPGGRVTMSAARLGEQWGWDRKRAWRRLNAWEAVGYIKRRGDTIMAVDGGGTKTIAADGTDGGTTGGTNVELFHGTKGGTDIAVVPVPSRKLARPTTSASRIVRHALAEPAETLAPVVTNMAGGPVAATVTAPPPVVNIPPRESGWYRFGSGVVGLALILLAGTVVLTSVRGGIWAGYALSIDANAGEIFSTLLVAAELFAAILPTAGRLYSHMGEGWSAWQARLLAVVASAAVLLSISAFILVNVGDKTAQREQAMAETPAVKTAQKALDDAKTARDQECVKLGTICRERQNTVSTRQTELNTAGADARKAAGVRADPQATALHLDPVTLRMVQAAVLVTICLMAGVLLNLGWGLVFPRR
jgi:hypothetical protein